MNNIGTEEIKEIYTILNREAAFQSDVLLGKPYSVLLSKYGISDDSILPITRLMVARTNTLRFMTRFADRILNIRDTHDCVELILNEKLNRYSEAEQDTVCFSMYLFLSDICNNNSTLNETEIKIRQEKEFNISKIGLDKKKNALINSISVFVNDLLKSSGITDNNDTNLWSNIFQMSENGTKSYNAILGTGFLFDKYFREYPTLAGICIGTSEFPHRTKNISVPLYSNVITAGVSGMLINLLLSPVICPCSFYSGTINNYGQHCKDAMAHFVNLIRLDNSQNTMHNINADETPLTEHITDADAEEKESDYSEEMKKNELPGN